MRSCPTLALIKIAIRLSGYGSIAEKSRDDFLSRSDFMSLVVSVVDSCNVQSFLFLLHSYLIFAAVFRSVGL